jgi:hypothetical protein
MLLRHGEPSLTSRWPWAVAFTFGLLHGSGCRFESCRAHQGINGLAVFHFTACWPPHQKCLASVLPVVLQQSVSYFSGFDLATISPRDRRFGGIFAIEVQAAGCISMIGTAFRRLSACERNVQIGDAHRGGRA